MSDRDVQLSLMPDAAPAYDASLAQWFTPPKLARRICQAFITPGRKIIEPSAGSGSLIHAALHAGDGDEVVQAFDIDPRWVDHLRERFACAPNFTAYHRNYLETGANIIRHRPPSTVLMNPPDASREGIDVADFMVKAMYDAGPLGDVVALLRLNCLTGVDRRENVWSRADILNVAYLSRRPAYGDGGGKQEWCVVRYKQPKGKRDPVQRPQTEWWGDAWN